jgi:aldehyde:ferredoxin oxidoreductase
MTASTYPFRILHIDLMTDQSKVDVVGGAIVRKYVGDTGLGVKFFYDEIPPKSLPETVNHLGLGHLQGIGNKTRRLSP